MLLTQKAYAKRKGVTPQYINKLVGQGKIVLVGKKVNPKQADGAIAAGRRVGAKSKTRSKSKTPTLRKKTAKDGAPHRAGQSAKLLGAVKHERSATATLTANRVRHEAAKADMAELEFKRASGELLPRAQVLEAERRKNANIRAKFRRLARSLAPTLAQATTPAEVERMLLGEIDLVLGQLSRDPIGALAGGGADMVDEIVGAMQGPSIQANTMGAAV